MQTSSKKFWGQSAGLREHTAESEFGITLSSTSNNANKRPGQLCCSVPASCMNHSTVSIALDTNGVERDPLPMSSESRASKLLSVRNFGATWQNRTTDALNSLQNSREGTGTGQGHSQCYSNQRMQHRHRLQPRILTISARCKQRRCSRC
jgi:hypothetical protein